MSALLESVVSLFIATVYNCLAPQGSWLRSTWQRSFAVKRPSRPSGGGDELPLDASIRLWQACAVIPLITDVQDPAELASTLGRGWDSLSTVELALAGWRLKLR